MRLSSADAGRLLYRLFNTEDRLLAQECQLPGYDDNAPLSPRMARINNMILRAAKWRLDNSPLPTR